MKLKDEAGWKKGLANNKDPYGARIYSYAKDWAELLEADMAASPESTPMQVILAKASQRSHEADTDGITGFMFGAAVSVLSMAWEHGEILRRWHNKDIAIGKEGDEANEKGTVLNPVLLRIG